MTAEVKRCEAMLAEVDAVSPKLTELGVWAETRGRLHEDANALLKQVGVPRLYLPSSLGGYAVSPVTCALVCEALADADSAAAWHVMVYNAARLMAAVWTEPLIESVWGQNPDAMVAASGHTPLQGRPTEGGFVVSGRNSFVSGVHHADYVMSPMMVGDHPYMVVVPQALCTIVDNWDTLGMRGTGSNDIELEEVEIPASMAVSQLAPPALNKHYTDTLYRCPSRVVFATYVPVALSMARRSLAVLTELAQNKVPYATDRKLREKTLAQLHYGKALGVYRSARAYFFDTMEHVWEQAGAGNEFSDTQRADLYLTGTHTLQACAEVVRHVADAAGSSVQVKGTPLERIVRDMETLRHHGFANESRFASVAQVLWGAELDYPLVLR